MVLASAQRRGAEIQGLGLAHALAERGHDAEVVALVAGGDEPLDVDVLGPSARSPRVLRSLRRRMRGTTVIAHGSTALPAVAVATLGTRTPWIYRSIGDPRDWVRGPLHRARTAALLARAERVVTLWPGAADAMRALYRVRRARLAVVPNNRSAAAFTRIDPAERAAARTRFGVDGPTVVYLGAFSEEKRPLDAVSAVGALEGVALLMAGRGPLAAAAAALGEQAAPGRVRVLGEVSDPAALLAAADVLVLPSRTEGMPGVIIEALLRGVPVVATAVGAVPDMVRDGMDGLVVAPGDPAALTGALATVIGDPARFARAGLDAPEHYGEDVVIDAWETLLRRCRSPRG